jgi:hypothetical protein
MASPGRHPVDYWEYESQGLGLTISMVVIATVSVILRFISRAKKLGYHADDWMIFPALFSFYGFGTVMIWGEETTHLIPPDF